MTDDIRLAMGRDTPIVAELLASFRDWLGKEEPSQLQELESSVRKIITEPGGEYLIAFNQAGEPVGVAQVRYRWSVWTNSEDCWLEDLYVLEPDRRQGLGRALVEAAFGRAAERGCERIELDVGEDNEAGLALYRSLGFSTESKGPARSLLMGRQLESG